MKNEMAAKLEDFLLFGYFGITTEDLNKKDETYIIKICAERAYLDLNRTLKFGPEYKDDKNDTKEELKEKAEGRLRFKNQICECISEYIIKDLICSNHDFDRGHKKLCDEIIRISEKGIITGGMTYGQAQKWVNMTMKYMWLLGIWNEEFKRVIDKIHVPVDSYIIEAVRKGKNFKEAAKVTPPTDGWSKWKDYDKYIKFQKDLRNAVENSPIEWEGPAWIEVAKSKKSQNDFKCIKSKRFF